MTDFHLAQINIAKAKDNLDSPVMHGFTSRLDEINTLAENSKGFVWRLKTDEGDATSIQAFEDELIIVNMSVWESIEDLKAFVYQSVHVDLIRGKKDWFDKMPTTFQALWWIPVGHVPSVAEGKEKLDWLENNGISEQAFTMARPYSHNT